VLSCGLKGKLRKKELDIVEIWSNACFSQLVGPNEETLQRFLSCLECWKGGSLQETREHTINTNIKKLTWLSTKIILPFLTAHCRHFARSDVEHALQREQNG